MDLTFTPEEEAFRAEVRAFIRDHLPARSAASSDGLDVESGLASLPALYKWNHDLLAKRWVGFNWPKEVGGGGGSLVEQMILKEEMARHKAPPLGLSYMGLAWVGPALIKYGSDEQKTRHIPPILRGDIQWCTGYSEPGAGSDLASLQCKAVRHGDEYVVSGQKIWTSLAMWSQWMILLVRTDFDAPKHLGITCLLVPMDSPGITVKPIKEMNGGAMFAEVFFEDVRVPVANRLGAEGQGWEVTKDALANERSSIADVWALKHRLEELKDLAVRCRRRGRRAIDDPSIRQRLARMETQVEAMRLNGLRFLTKQLRGEALGAETSINKLIRAKVEIESGRLARDIEGTFGVLAAKSPHAIDDGKWQKVMLSWPPFVIGGGTPNIQRNVIAERLLGLPHDT
jgi:alkylation response protein AidB-like acyl-CoA dehydrogenase